MEILKPLYIKLRRNFYRAVNFIAGRVGLKVVSNAEYKQGLARCEAARELMELLIENKRPNEHAGKASCIIFSMDRAMQLHALLCGYFEKINSPVPVYVLYRATSDSHRAAYEEVFALFRDKSVTPVYQEKDTFRQQLLEIMEAMDSEKLFFLVDDILFTERIDLDVLLSINSRKYVPSLRLGDHLNRQYTTRLHQPLPPVLQHPLSAKGLLVWCWGEGELDWGYPLSVDGNIFYRDEILVFSRNYDFVTPNQFEGALQVFRELYAFRFGVCFKKSVIVNVPVNRVQTDVANIHGDIHQDQLLKKWNEGFRIDYQSVYGLVNQSAHQELILGFALR